MPHQSDILTASEAASVTRVPLKQVHRIFDSGLLRDAVQTRSGARVIHGRGLVGLRLAHLTADTLTLDARRRIIGRLLDEPRVASVRDEAVSIAVEPVALDVRKGLETLDRAKAMVASDPAVMGGTPCVAGTRIPVHDLADVIANGDSINAVAAAYPLVTAEQVQLAVVYATAYPRRGRPPARRAWKKAAPGQSKTLSLDELPRAS